MAYDVVIVGGGPAGLTAGIYARTRKLSTLILEAQAVGGQLSWLYPTKSVYDYPSHIAIEGKEVVDLKRLKSGFRLTTKPGPANEAKTTLLAMGMGLFEPKRLGIPGEAEFEGRGVEYRVRDRHEYKDRRVLVVGGGDSALEIALEIVASAPQVILVPRRGEFRAMEKNVEAVLKSPVKVLYNAEVTFIEGDDRVRRAVVYDNRTLKKSQFEIDGVLVNIGFEPKSTPLPRWGIELEGERLIKVKADMSTSVEGIYACGDIVSYPGKDKRIVTACGEAVTAIMSVYKHLRSPYWA